MMKIVSWAVSNCILWFMSQEYVIKHRQNNSSGRVLSSKKLTCRWVTLICKLIHSILLRLSNNIYFKMIAATRSLMFNIQSLGSQTWSRFNTVFIMNLSRDLPDIDVLS